MIVAYLKTPSWYIIIMPVILMYLLDSVVGNFSLSPAVSSIMSPSRSTCSLPSAGYLPWEIQTILARLVDLLFFQASLTLLPGCFFFLFLSDSGSFITKLCFCHREVRRSMNIGLQRPEWEPAQLLGRCDGCGSHRYRFREAAALRVWVLQSSRTASCLWSVDTLKHFYGCT